MALRKVNLIPEAVVLRRLQRRHLAVWLVVLLGGLLLVGALHLYYTSTVLARMRPKRDIDDVRRELAVSVAEIGDTQSKLEKLAFVRKISRARLASEVTHALSTVLQEGTWLTDFKIQRNEKDHVSEVSINGWAASSADVGTLVNRLAAAPLFRDVALKYVKEGRHPVRGTDEGAPESVTLFSVVCDVPDRS